MASKRRLAGDTAREATSGEGKALGHECQCPLLGSDLDNGQPSPCSPRPRDRHHTDLVRRKQHNPRPPYHLLQCVSAGYLPFQRRPVPRRQPDACLCLLHASRLARLGEFGNHPLGLVHRALDADSSAASSIRCLSSQRHALIRLPSSGHRRAKVRLTFAWAGSQRTSCVAVRLAMQVILTNLIDCRITC